MFDVAEYRRRMGFQRIPDLESAEDVQIRRKSYEDALLDVESFLTSHDNGVAIIDSSCITHELRLTVRNKVSSYLFSPQIIYPD
jgi:hypothetical protein